MRRILAILLIAALLSGCAGGWTTVRTQEAYSYCAAEAIFSAWVWGKCTGQPVRIALQHIEPGVDHAQAEYFDGSKWIPLTPNFSQRSRVIIVTPYKRHFNVEPGEYYTLREFVGDQIQWTNQ